MKKKGKKISRRNCTIFRVEDEAMKKKPIVFLATRELSNRSSWHKEWVGCDEQMTKPIDVHRRGCISSENYLSALFEM